MPIEIGSVIEGKVTGIANFGAFVELPEGAVGLVHISQVSEKYVKDINEHLRLGDVVKVKVLGINQKGKYDLSIKQASKQEFASAMPLLGRPMPERPRRGDRSREPKHPPGSLEDKISQFLKQSDEKLLDLKKNIQEKQGGIKKRTTSK
jgi:S1 RNA binding domain protein